jgi:hypothetical protein
VTGVQTCALPISLRATEIEVGLLLNFGPKPEFKRAVFDNSRKKGLPKENTNS